MRVLILGGTGLISQYITRQLHDRGDEVLHLNRGRTAAPHHTAVTTLPGERGDAPALAAAVRGAGPLHAVIDMIGYTPDDATGLVGACRGVVEHVVFCSTVDVYDKPYRVLPVTESHPLGGLGEYARRKVACERILEQAAARGDFALTTIRPAHTYGEGRGFFGSYMNGTMYLDRLRRGKPVLVHGDGQSLWTACHGEDVARAFLGALDQPAARGHAYHTTADEWLTWNRYHDVIAEVLGAPAPALVHVPSELLAKLAPSRCGVCWDNFQFDNIFDNSAARRDLGFRQTIGFADGVRRVVAWLEAHGGFQNSDDDQDEDRIIAAWQASCQALVAQFGA